MAVTEIISQQIIDPFRIILMIALVMTMLRNRATTGVIVPLIAGAVFVAVLIPSTMAAQSPYPYSHLVGLGLVTNAIMLAVILGIWQLITKAKNR